MTEVVLGVTPIPARHQITIPKRVMRTFGLKTNDMLEFINKDGILILRKQSS